MIPGFFVMDEKHVNKSLHGKSNFTVITLQRVAELVWQDRRGIWELEAKAKG